MDNLDRAPLFSAEIPAPSTVPPSPPLTLGEHPQPPDRYDQIRQLVARIEQFGSRARRGYADRYTKGSPPAARFPNTPLPITPSPAQTSARPEDVPIQASAAAALDFECDADGVVDWVGSGPRAALIGLCLTDPAPQGEFGVDARTAAAVRRRAPFQATRLVLGGSGPWAGTWLLDGVPAFNARNGGFTGYRLAGRRAHKGQVVGRPLIAGLGLNPDSLRQLVHELRTPLSAVDGFSQMIDGQLQGPVAHGYRRRVQAIRAEAAHLLAVVEELDLINQFETGQAPADGPVCDAQWLDDAVRSAGWAGTRAIAPGITLRVAPDAFGLLASRLIAIVRSAAEENEALSLRLESAPTDVKMAVFALTRPLGMRGISVGQLLDPRNKTLTERQSRAGAPQASPAYPLALGSAFALRFVATIADRFGGRLVIEDEWLTIWLPRLELAKEPRSGAPCRDQ